MCDGGTYCFKLYIYAGELLRRADTEFRRYVSNASNVVFGSSKVDVKEIISNMALNNTKKED